MTKTAYRDYIHTDQGQICVDTQKTFDSNQWESMAFHVRANHTGIDAKNPLVTRRYHTPEEAQEGHVEIIKFLLKS